MVELKNNKSNQVIKDGLTQNIVKETFYVVKDKKYKGPYVRFGIPPGRLESFLTDNKKGLIGILGSIVGTVAGFSGNLMSFNFKNLFENKIVLFLFVIFVVGNLIGFYLQIKELKKKKGTKSLIKDIKNHEDTLVLLDRCT